MRPDNVPNIEFKAAFVNGIGGESRRLVGAFKTGNKWLAVTRIVLSQEKQAELMWGLYHIKTGLLIAEFWTRWGAMGGARAIERHDFSFGNLNHFTTRPVLAAKLLADLYQAQEVEIRSIETGE